MYNSDCRYDIREIGDIYRGRSFILEVRDIAALPTALTRLAEMGYDMTASLSVLQQAVERNKVTKGQSNVRNHNSLQRL